METDRYRYFRIEAREVLESLAQGVLALEKGTRDPDLVRRLLREAHTLKGAARVVRQTGIAARAHVLEDALARWREAPPSSAQANELLRSLDEIGELVAALGPAQPGAAPPRPVSTEGSLETVRIEVSELDALLDSVFEAGVPVVALRRELDGLEQARRLASALHERLAANGWNGVTRGEPNRERFLAEELLGTLQRSRRGLGVAADEQERELAQVREAAGRLRLLPASALFAVLERGVRDAAQTLGRAVVFEASGGEHRIDASALPALRDALLHVVMNAVAHGIEPEAERLAAGKAPAGRVELRVRRRGARLAFECQDDGRGIDVAAVVAAATRGGLLAASEAEGLGPREALRLALRDGVTTASATTQVSGRGIGLDVVRSTAERLKGTVELRTEQGRGTRVELSVPISLASLPTLTVSCGSATCSLPLDAVRRAVRTSEAEIARSEDATQILVDGEALPLIWLSDVLRRDGAALRERSAFSAAILDAGGERAALAVDRFLGIDTVVVRSLPAATPADSAVAGASLEADGSPRLLLDPAALVAAARLGKQRAPAGPPPERPPVLVVDDSLTTRMLEQSILESAGYDVELAVSGEEALAKARRRRYRLFVVDVEMPGMDGFQLLEELRADPLLHEVPAILVTSRSSSDDRRRGELAGARAYIVKSEFDQVLLLDTIRRLVG